MANLVKESIEQTAKTPKVDSETFVLQKQPKKKNKKHLSRIHESIQVLVHYRKCVIYVYIYIPTIKLELIFIHIVAAPTLCALSSHYVQLCPYTVYQHLHLHICICIHVVHIIISNRPNDTRLLQTCMRIGTTFQTFN